MATDKHEWNIKSLFDPNEPTCREMARSLGVTPLTAQLLINRGCGSIKEAESYLNKEDFILHDPFIFEEMEEAVARILIAVENKEKIVVYGDYDVDGVTSVSVLLLYLRSIGADAEYYIPNRIGEGYGLSLKAADKFASDGVKLMITVDTGITAVEEAKYCKSLGIDIVITDHHECHDVIPEVCAVINPRIPGCAYPFKELAGVGVVFKLICAIETRKSGDTLINSVRRVCADYIDLVAIGTVADVMPLSDENRLIVAEGLRVMNEPKRPGIRALIIAVDSEAKKFVPNRKMTTSYISFSLAPRINAAGRISAAGIAVELFLCEDRDRAKEIAVNLCDINKNRQLEENRIAESAGDIIKTHPEYNDYPVMVLSDETWHHGVIGIVSSRITEKYSRPSILVSFEGTYNGDGPSPEDIGKGSGRSVKGINLVDALKNCSDILEKFGGHELAAGLSVKRKNLQALQSRLNEYAREQSFGSGEYVTVYDCDAEISTDEITTEQVEEMYLLEPFGVSNPVPLFLVRNVNVFEVISIGAGKHTKFIVGDGDDRFAALCFRHAQTEYEIYPGDKVDILFNMDINDFQGNKSVQLLVKDIRLSESVINGEKPEYDRYCGIISDLENIGMSDKVTSADVPDRNDLAYLYSYLRGELRNGIKQISVRELMYNLDYSGKNTISSVKARFCLDIFNEMGLFKLKLINKDTELYGIKYVEVTGKIDIESSGILTRLRASVGQEK